VLYRVPGAVPSTRYRVPHPVPCTRHPPSAPAAVPRPA
jgi:hypothetical protein